MNLQKLLRSDRVAIGIFIAFVLIFFSPTILSGKLPVPSDTLVGLYHPWRDLYAGQYPRGIPFKNFLITDPIRQQIPWRKLVIEDLKSGTIPAWNPYAFSGTPLLGNIQTGALYPLNVLFFLFSFPVAWSLLIILEPLLSGLFLFWYLRSLQRSPIASILASVAWAFSGFSVSWMTWGTIVHVALWLPILLLGTDRMISARERRVRLLWSAVVLVACICAFLAGHVQIFLYVLITAGSYGLFRMIQRKEKPTLTNRKMSSLLSDVVDIGRRNKEVLACFSAIGIIFLILTSPVWRELLTLAGQSSRLSDISFHTEGWFIPIRHLIGFFVPDFFGNPATLNYWGTWNYGELTGYIGVIPLFFAIVALCYIRRRVVWFWGGVLGASLLFSIKGPVSSLPYIFSVPILSALQPTRLMVLIVFSLVMLSAYGIDYYLLDLFPARRLRLASILFTMFFVVIAISVQVVLHLYPDFEIQTHLLISRRNIILPGVLAVLLFVSLLVGNRRNLRYGMVVFLALVTVFDLYRFGTKFTPFTDPRYFFPETKIIRFLESTKGPYRIMVTDDRLLPPNVSAYYHLESVSGYDPLYSGSYETFIAAMEKNTPNITPPYGFNRIVNPKRVDSPLFSLLNVRYVLSFEPLPGTVFHLLMQEGMTKLYEVINPIPRVFLTQEVQSLPQKEILSALFTAGFSVKTRAIVDEQLSISSQSMEPGETVTINTYTDSSLVAGVSVRTKRFLATSMVYYPHWHALIDNNEVHIYKTNFTFMGVVVPEGNHSVEFRYEPFN